MSVQIVTANDADSGVLTCSATVQAGLPLTNLQRRSGAKITRINSGGAQFQIHCAWPDMRVIGAMALLGAHFTSGATVRGMTYRNANFTTLVYDSGAVILQDYGYQGWGNFDWGYDTTFPPNSSWGGLLAGQSYDGTRSLFFRVPSPTAVASFVIRITDPGQSVFDARRLWAGPVIEPASNMDFGFETTVHEDAERIRTESGHIRSEVRRTWRAFRLTLAHLANTEPGSYTYDTLLAERGKLLTALRRAGVSNSLLLRAHPASTGAQAAELDQDTTAEVVVANPSTLTHDRPLNWRAELQFEEV